MLVLVHVADATERAPVGTGLAESLNFSAGRTAQSQQQFDQRGLAGTVGAEQGKNAAGGDFQTDIEQGGVARTEPAGFVSLGDVFVDRDVGHVGPDAMGKRGWC